MTIAAQGRARGRGKVIRTVTQSEKAHNANQLHEQFIAAGLTPSHVESTAEESRFTFADGTSETAIQAVIDAHTATTRDPAASLKAILLLIDGVNFEGVNLESVDFDTPTTFAQLKPELVKLKAELIKHRQRCISLRTGTVKAFKQVWNMVD